MAADGMMPTPGSPEHKVAMRRLRKEAETVKNELSHQEVRLEPLRTRRHVTFSGSAAL